LLKLSGTTRVGRPLSALLGSVRGLVASNAIGQVAADP
jgi:hypothetical protein